VVVALAHDCQHFRVPMVVVGHEGGRDAALVQKDEVGSQVVLLSVVEELVELFGWAQVLLKVSRCPGVNKQVLHTICGSIE